MFIREKSPDGEKRRSRKYMYRSKPSYMEMEKEIVKQWGVTEWCLAIALVDLT